MLQNPPIKKSDGRISSNKTNRYAKYLERTFQPNEDENMFDWENLIQEEGIIRLRIETKETLNPKKTRGFDSIARESLTQLPYKAIVKLFYLINASVRIKYVPKI